MQIIKLNKGREQSVLRRHPWIFSRAIHSGAEALEDGETILIQDYKGSTIGTGHYQNSSLSVRLLAFEGVETDAAFWLKRLSNAAACREALNVRQEGITDTFRLVHGEGDQLPGLIIDIYGPVAVVQAHSIGMYKALTDITQALLQIDHLALEAVYTKSKDALPTHFAQQVTDGWLHGHAPERLIVHEGGVAFQVNVETGQKTGFFLDQRENRELIRKYAHGKEVFNGFCYSGGFSLYALLGGATHVVSIDSSQAALDLLEQNLKINTYSGTHESIKENVLTWLGETDKRFDIVIVDPPAFAKTLKKRHNAIQAYKRLNMMAIARVKKGGMLFTFSCSQVVDKPLFHNTIVAAAIESGRQARIVHELSQGPDHPVSIFHPEGHYLKGLALYLD
jgi:23S rRNA (cytosine1962-C5)-methyltransferase